MSLLNDNQIDDCEWDESDAADATLTTWSLAQASRQQSRGKRTYGRRSSSMSNIQIKLPLSASTGVSNVSASGKMGQPTKVYGRAKLPSRSSSIEKSEPSITGSMASTMTAATATTTKPHSQRSISLASFNDIGCGSIYEENLHPNISLYGDSFQLSQDTLGPFNGTSNSTSTGIGNSCNDSLSFSIHSGAACFSSLRRGSATSTYSGFVDDSHSHNNNDNNNNSSAFILPCLTPSRSVSSSSRKRGVCESPLIHGDDMSSSADCLSGSKSHLSTSSFGSSRRARSRIFSPESTKKIMEKAAARANFRFRSSSSLSTTADNHNHYYNYGNSGSSTSSTSNNNNKIEKDEEKDMTSIRKKNESFHESESEGEIELEMEEDTSFSFYNNTSCELSHTDLEEMHHNHKKNELASSTGRTTIDEKKKHILPLPLRPRRMSSVGDMPFEQAVFAPVESIINATTNQSEKREGEAVFDTMSSYEDLKFLVKELRRWSSGKLLASFGMSKNCTVVPPNSWSSSRRAAFVEWMTTHLGFCHRCCGGAVNYLQTSASKAKQLQLDMEKALLEYKATSRKNMINDKACATVKKKDFAAVAPLHETPIPMSSIRISRMKSTPGYTPMSIERHSASHRDNCDNVLDDLAGNLNSLSLEHPWSASACNIQDRDYDNDSIHSGAAPLTRMVTLPDDIPYSANRRPPRLSCEHSIMDARDFMSHMHGVSPQVYNNKNRIRPSTLVLPRRPFSGGKSNIPSTSPAIPILTAALSFDQVETPGVHKLNNRRWGSRPIEGKDWGQSEPCIESVIGILTSRFEEACSCMGNFILDPFTNTSSCFVRPGMSGVKADSKSLGIEFEADILPKLETLVDLNDTNVEIDEGDNSYIDDESLSNEDLKPHSDHPGGALSLAELNEDIITPQKLHKRRVQSYAKRNRMSICNSALASTTKPFRASVFQSKPSFAYEVDLYPCRQSIAGPSPVKRRGKSLTPIDEDSRQLVLTDTAKLFPILSFLSEQELQCTASLVCSTWADAATDALASLMLISVGCNMDEMDEDADEDCDGIINSDDVVSLSDKCAEPCSIAMSMQRSWEHINERFPWGSFLSEGAFKRVFRVWNSAVSAEEAVSVMDVNKIDDKNIVGNELAVSVMLSSLARRHVCPNFVKMRGVFTAAYEPSKSQWGCAENKQPRGSNYDASCSRPKRKIREPAAKNRGLYQYIRMELCKYGDVEEFIKKQSTKSILPAEARCLLFQMAYSLHVAGDRYGLKHYDIKLLNFFLHDANDSDIMEEENPYTVLRYGLGSHVFNLRMSTSRALIAKLADFGTANTRPESDGQPVMLNNFTTLENTPPDFMILGDAAVQGYGHDCFGLGLCMLHLFTGDAPYEEIMESVRCPLNLRKKLKRVWEDKGNRSSNGYTVIGGVITLDIWEDENGKIQSEADETLFDTLYRYLVLFGIPEHKFQWKEGCKVWAAIHACLEIESEKSPSKMRRSRRNNNPGKNNRGNKNIGLDLPQYQADCELFSLQYGKDERITRARDNLESMDGGMELLLSLVSFDPNKRASALDVMNSTFMTPLREEEGNNPVQEDDKVYSYMSYLVVQEGD